jgi:Na+-driven multidrug efflux pump
MNNDSIALMERERPFVAIIRLTLPMMLTMIAQMYNMIDIFFIGQTGGDPNTVVGICICQFFPS